MSRKNIRANRNIQIPKKVDPSMRGYKSIWLGDSQSKRKY